jgi:predicted nucleic acid-binding protein
VTLVDTSVWIELLSGRAERPTPDQLSQFVACGPLSRKCCKGLRPGRDSAAFQESLLAIPCLSDPMPLGLFLDAAEIFREGRRKGHPVRSTTDCLIAAIAIDNGVPLWHRDRDFDAIAKYTPLRISG